MPAFWYLQCEVREYRLEPDLNLRVTHGGLPCTVETCLPCSVSSADPPSECHVGGFSLNWGNWKFKPIFSSNPTSGCRVQSLLALAKSEAVTGDNIVAVWYVRGETPTSEWTMKSWRTSDPVEAIKFVKGELAISDAEDELWDMDGSLATLPGENPEAPQNYSKGLLLDDPLFPLVEFDPDGSQLIGLLTDIGYKSATIELDWKDNCPGDNIVERIAVGFDWGVPAGL